MTTLQVERRDRYHPPGETSTLPDVIFLGSDPLLDFPPRAHTKPYTEVYEFEDS